VFSKVLFPCLGLLLLSLATDLGAETISTARQQYGDAMEAIDKGRWTEYEQLRPVLDDYPLSIYLDYSQLTRQPAQVRPADAKRFISLSQDSPLPNRFLAVYLTRAGRDKRWNDFLATKPDEPNAIELKCYYFRAQLASGNVDIAWAGAERLWVYGQSRPKECDPLFDAWLKADQLRDDVVWARLLKTFDTRQRSLMTYVARQGSDQLKPWSDRLLEINRHPDTLRRQTLPAKDPRSAQVVTHALPYLARYKPELALEEWQYFKNTLDFSDDQRATIEHALVLRSLFAKSEQNRSWVDDALSRLSDDLLVEIRLRWALEDADWAALELHLPKLSAQKQGEPVWRYWAARAHQAVGRQQQYEAELATLAGERGYYSFLAADRLKRGYAFEHQPLMFQAAGTDPLEQLPAVRRIEELYFHDENNLAHSEWYKVLTDSSGAGQREELALLARRQGWHRLAIDAASKAQAWNLLDLRFPLAYESAFERHGLSVQVPPTELMAIARRESAFYPGARSPVGARGLMQIMPATGKQVAAKIGTSHSSADLYEVEHNILLGSVYYRQLLDRYDGNRIFALAAYNAGPHRVDRWRNSPDDALTAEQWVATIPFKETRRYVQAVLEYNVVFQYLQGSQVSVLTEAERLANY
jgi:soluble lytic murein transglycosylase